ncbi:hypothetical protein D7294_11670 [Streptomyces hoynatensis]|uniref:Uncharacterized protein n=1 Tax=Streptomyces hoynatensis TaxID=1141874 RepID=A0A3A9Z4I1_9ACTN|nr:hypothetical protein D7294_11670 [Streptomyces hoynatensis]
MPRVKGRPSASVPQAVRASQAIETTPDQSASQEPGAAKEAAVSRQKYPRVLKSSTSASAATPERRSRASRPSAAARAAAAAHRQSVSDKAANTIQGTKPRR